MSENKKWIGVDYGSKLAGTTVICYEAEGSLMFVQSDKKKDADKFIIEFIDKNKIENIFIDAPLSLPAAYFGKGENYFYRQCDVETKAMSPMFLGGLTARAIKLQSQFPQKKFKETYPAYLIKEVLQLSDLYLKKKPYENAILKVMNLNIVVAKINNWHQFDALSCWLSGKRYFENEALKIGNFNEGVIVV